VIAVSFLADGKYFLTAEASGVVRLWEMGVERPLYQSADLLAPTKPLAPRAYLADVVFSADGRSVDMVVREDRRVTHYRSTVPVPVAGEVQQVVLWTQLLTGMELDDEGKATPLDGAVWQERSPGLKQRGGWPAP
jgi:hypothetical protein